MLSARQLTEFVILDIEPVAGGAAGGHGGVQLAEAQVARAADFGRNDAVLFTRTHLGAVLKPGDMAWGYDVAGANLVDPEIEKFRNLDLPDVILVRKSYEARRRHARACSACLVLLERVLRRRRRSGGGGASGAAARGARGRCGAWTWRRRTATRATAAATTRAAALRRRASPRNPPGFPQPAARC